jgi:hypothetical protein
MAESVFRRFSSFAIALLFVAGGARAAVESPLHRELFKAYYYDFVERHPEAFMRHRVAIVAPDQLETFKAFESTHEALEQIFRILPKPSISFGAGPVSFSVDGDNLAALRDVVARTPLGVGLAPKDITDAEYRQYMDTHHDEVSKTADAIYDLVREGTQTFTSTIFTPQQVALLREEFAANLASDPKLKSPAANFDALLANAPASFDRMMRAADASLTKEQLAAIRADVNAFKAFTEGKFRTAPTDAQLRELFGGVAGELKDVRAFIKDQRESQERLRKSQEIHAAVDILSTLIGFVDPVNARKFATIAHNTVIAAETIATMTALTFTGVGTVVVAVAAIAQVFSAGQPSEQEQLQSFILEIYRDIMRELAEIKRGLFEIRVQLAAIDARIGEVLLNSSIGFTALDLQLQGTRAMLQTLSIEAQAFFEASSLDHAEAAHSDIVDKMTNPANEALRQTLRNEPSGAVAAAVQQSLARIAQLGREDSKESPFSLAIALDGAIFTNARAAAGVEYRVADLPNLATLLAAHGATPRVALLQSVANPAALAQSIAWYADARDRLPRPTFVDANFGLLCNEVQRVHAAAVESRNLTPAALRLVSSAAKQLLQIGKPILAGSPPVDAAFLSGAVAAPLPDEAGKRIDLALAANGGFSQSFVIAQPVPVTVAADGTATLAGCATVEQVVFDGTPTVTADSFGVKQFSGARRLLLRSRRRVCAADHPVTASPASAFGAALENTVVHLGAALAEEPRSAEETAANDAGLRRIGEFLTRKRGAALAESARAAGIIKVNPLRRSNHVIVVSDPEPGVNLKQFFGSVKWIEDATWADDVPGRADLPPVAWTFSIRHATFPAGGLFTLDEVQEFGDKVRDQKLGSLVDVPFDKFTADLRRLENVVFNVQTARAKQAVDAWQKGAADHNHPLARAIVDLRVARYALDTFARFGFGDCSDGGDALNEALLLVNCSDGSCDNADAPDTRLGDPHGDFLALHTAADAVAKMAAFDAAADALETRLHDAGPGLCRDAGPFGLAEATGILNGIARRSVRFLPEGCPF